MEGVPRAPLGLYDALPSLPSAITFHLAKTPGKKNPVLIDSLLNQQGETKNKNKANGSEALPESCRSSGLRPKSATRLWAFCASQGELETMASAT